MKVVRLILFGSLSAVGLLGAFACLAASFVPHPQLAELFHSSNRPHGTSFQTNIEIVGINRSGLFAHILRRDWTGEEAIFRSTWRNTKFEIADAKAPQTSTLGFAGFVDRRDNGNGGGILCISVWLPLWAIASLSLLAALPAVVSLYHSWYRRGQRGFAVVVRRPAGEG